MKAKLAEETRERDSKISLLEVKFKETERSLLKLQREKDEYAQKLTQAYTEQDEIEQREQIIVDYEYKVRNLEKELRTVQTERDYLERKSRTIIPKTPNVARRIEDDPSFQMVRYRNPFKNLIFYRRLKLNSHDFLQEETPKISKKKTIIFVYY